NVHNRTPTIHVMPEWAKKFFIEWLPKYLCMQRPTPIRIELASIDATNNSKIILTKRSCFRLTSTPINRNRSSILSTSFELEHFPCLASASSTFPKYFENFKCKHCKSTALQNAVDNVTFIANYLKDNENDQQVSSLAFIIDRIDIAIISGTVRKIIEDWKYISMILDRIFFILFTSACMIGSAIIILRAPTIYDRTVALA
uniref:Neur_chan_memb domain-containing protein n=1 Tax=Loa loa TaxID=7209 RepID=A0A1I7VEH7_LOALO